MRPGDEAAPAGAAEAAAGLSPSACAVATGESSPFAPPGSEWAIAPRDLAAPHPLWPGYPPWDPRCFT